MWSHDEYWEKARLYVRRAQYADSDEGLYPFWMSLAMEFIARAALSKINPVLNADPSQPENIYFALGLEEVGSPKTIPLHAVFVRCVRLVQGFEDSHRRFCDFLGVQRNEELHTGRLAFESLKLQDWLQNYYEVAAILCSHLERSLDDLLGTDEADAARELLRASAEGLQSEVKRSISAHKQVFDSKSEDERQQLSNDAYIRALSNYRSIDLAELEDCPSCDCRGLVTGRAIRRSRPYYDDYRLSEEVTVLAETYACYACGLNLPTASHLRWSGIEPQFIIVLETDLHEQQEFEYYEEYMNE